MSYVLYADSLETKPADEDANIGRVVAVIGKLLEKAAAKAGKKVRDVHVKSHGCARGQLVVEAGLPEELAQGLFGQPARFDAVVRFSNGAGEAQADHERDARGMALKLFGVPGEKLLEDERGAGTHDFVMVNYPVFVARNAADYLPLEQAIAADKSPVTGGDWNPFHWHWHAAKIAFLDAWQRVTNPVCTTYYSMAPIRYGRHVAKYRVLPVQSGPFALPHELTKVGHEPDALRALLIATLASREVRFEFQVQLCTSTETMPIEDPTIEWPEDQSPYRTVATLSLPRQDITSPAWYAAGEQLSFTVWHAIAAHRPLGGINRLRKEAYRLSSTWRHEPGNRHEPASLADIDSPPAG